MLSSGMLWKGPLNSSLSFLVLRSVLRMSTFGFEELQGEVTEIFHGQLIPRKIGRIGREQPQHFPHAGSSSGTRAIALKSVSKHEGSQIGLIPASFETFIVNSHFRRRFLSQEIEGTVAQDG